TSRHSTPPSTQTPRGSRPRRGRLRAQPPVVLPLPTPPPRRPRRRCAGDGGETGDGARAIRPAFARRTGGRRGRETCDCPPNSWGHHPCPGGGCAASPTASIVRVPPQIDARLRL